MKKLKQITAFGMALLLFTAQTQLAAEEVRLYSTPPSAAEMGEVIFGTNTPAPGGVRTRSINFSSNKNKSAIESHEAITGEKTSIGLPIEFAYNSTDILPDSMPFVEEVGKMMTMPEYGNKKLVIEGHTDAKGSDRYNKSLSIRRARAVGDYLVMNYQISRNRLITRGLGESKPLEGRDPYDEVNRRVQFYSAN
jgi:OmpA-OmpF porin, OOP family